MPMTDNSNAPYGTAANKRAFPDHKAEGSFEFISEGVHYQGIGFALRAAG